MNTPADFTGLSDDARRFLRARFAPATARAYRSDWSNFLKHCQETAASPLPADGQTLGNFAAALAASGSRYARIARAVAAVCTVHRLTAHPCPRNAAARGVLAGIRRALGTAQKQAAPLRAFELQQHFYRLPEPRTARELRDRAILLTCFTGCFRRGELAALRAGDVLFFERGAEITLQKSKTDPESKGTVKTLPRAANPAACAARALQAWVNYLLPEPGAPLFCSIAKGDRVIKPQPIAGETVNRIVKKTFGSRYSGHSLRVGFCVTARENGAPMEAIQKAGAWSRPDMPARYTKAADAWAGSAAKFLGL